MPTTEGYRPAPGTLPLALGSVGTVAVLCATGFVLWLRLARPADAEHHAATTMVPRPTATAPLRPVPTFTPRPEPRSEPAAAFHPVPAAPASSARTEASGTVNANSNLRDGPGKEHAVVGRLAEGARFTAVAVSADGRWVQLRDGRWLFAGLADGLPPDLSRTGN